MSLYIDMKWKNEYVFFLLSFILCVILIQHSASMNLFEYMLTLFVLSIILMFVYYIFTHTKESYENTRGGMAMTNVMQAKEDENDEKMPNELPHTNLHTVWNYFINLPRYVREFGMIGNDIKHENDDVTLDFSYAQQNHPTYYKLGVFDSLQDKSERYFNEDRFREIQSKIKYMNAVFAWLQKYKSGIYNRLREKFSSQQRKAR